MARLVQSEELELEPLLIAHDGPANEEDMSVLSVNQDFGYDKDVEKVTHRLSQASDTFEEEKRLVRKLDTRILPIVCILYLFACESTDAFYSHQTEAHTL